LNRIHFNLNNNLAKIKDMFKKLIVFLSGII